MKERTHKLPLLAHQRYRRRTTWRRQCYTICGPCTFFSGCVCINQKFMKFPPKQPYPLKLPFSASAPHQIKPKSNSQTNIEKFVREGNLSCLWRERVLIIRIQRDWIPALSFRLRTAWEVLRGRSSWIYDDKGILDNLRCGNWFKIHETCDKERVRIVIWRKLF